MIKNFTLSIFLLFFFLTKGQTYVMNNGSNGAFSVCSGIFVDKGGTTGNYWSAQNSTITFCPSTPGSKVRLSFTEFSTEQNNDYLAIWNANTITNPASADAVYTGTLSPFTITSTSPDGCLTLKFVSNNIINKLGWIATISCARPCNAPIAAFTDNSTINICGSSSSNPSSTSVSFNGSASHSPSGDTITKYIWQWGDGTTSTTTSPITTHNFSTQGIYVVKLKVRDSNYDFDTEGCLSDSFATKIVRVLPPTTIANTTNNFNISCGNSVTLNGSASSQTLTENPIAPYISPITISNNNSSGYVSTIDYTGFFPQGTTLQAGCYPTVTLNLEHSFSTDLTIDLMAPNGTIVRLFNRSNAGGPIFSGINFGSCSNNNDDGVPGCGTPYSVVNSGGASWNSPTSKTSASSSCPGYTGTCNGMYYYISQAYTSAESFTALNGTPLNGTWKLIVNDLQSFDDGVLFGWSLSFPTSCYNTIQSVTPSVTALNWSHNGNGPSIPIQTTTNTNITNPGPDICPTPDTCIGNTVSNNVTVGPFVNSGTYTYTLTATNQFGCQYTRNYTVNVTCAACSLTLSSATSTTNQTKCLGNSISNISYSVSGSPTSINVTGLPTGVTYSYNAGIITISGTPNATGIYNYSISTLGCTPNATTSGTITVTAPVNAGTISGNTTLCAGTTSTLIATTTGGSWASSNTAVATVNNAGTVSALAAGATTITYTVNGSGSCPNATATTTVTVTAPVNPGTISDNTTLCAGTTSTLVATTTGGSWASSNTAVATVNNAGIVSALAAGATTITYTVNGSGGCPNATATTTVTVTAPVNAGTISGNTTLCAGTTSTLIATTTGGSWASSNTAVATVNNAGIVSALTAGTSTITYTVNGSGGCPNATATTTVTVTAPVNAGTISGNTTLCAGTTSTLVATTTGGSWASSNTAVATVNNAGIVSALAAGTATITYTVNGSGGCPNATATTTVTVGSNNIVLANGDTVVAYIPGGSISFANGNSILSNDTLNGNPIQLSNTTINVISTSNPNVTLNTTTGQVVVGNNVPEDEYQIVYQLCTTGCNVSCSTATITVRVMNLFTIPQKSAYVFACYTDTQIRSYDSVFDEGFTIAGLPANASNATVVVTSGNGIFAYSDGTIGIVPGTISYEDCPLSIPFTYVICSNSNCTNTLTGYIKVSPSLFADNDKFTFDNSGIVCGDEDNILLNDIYNSCDNGSSKPKDIPANSGNISINITSMSSNYFNVDLVSGRVQATTTNIPTGEYTINYQICDLSNPNLCKNARVYINVGNCFNSLPVLYKEKSVSNTSLVSISPNPSSGIFSLQFDKFITTETKIKVRNTLGQNIYSTTINNTISHEFDLSQFPTGSYAIEIENGSELIIKRIIKK